MRIASLCFLVSLTITALLWSCQKEVNLQDDINTPGGGGGGGSTIGDPGWSFTAAGNAKYYGCVDTAYYETISGIKTLSIDVTDSADNAFSIIFASPGNFTTTTYTPATGATMIFTSHDGNSYISSTASSFSIKVASINDTLITAEFTATLSDPIGGGTFTISNGKLKALIGKHNGCSIDYTGGGNNGGGSDNADYYLLDGPGNCTSAQLQGNYIKDSVLTQDHNVSLDVYVDVEGKWTASTSTVNGIKFSGSGEFTSTGPNSIILQATGKPVAIGSFELPLTAGTSVCQLLVEVDTLQIASCNPINNSFDFKVGGIADGSFTQVNTLIDNGNYQVSGHGPGDMQIQFPGPNQPDPGVYNIVQIGAGLSSGEAAIGITSTNIFWSPLDGKLYVSVVNGKVVATFCDVTFTGTLGNSYTSKVSSKITEN